MKRSAPRPDRESRPVAYRSTFRGGFQERVRASAPWAFALVVGASASGLVACPPPADSTPKAPPPDAGADAAPTAKRAGPARVFPLERGKELGGPNATGKPGDWVIENDEVVFVVDGLGGGGGFAESGGNVVDAADAKGRKDELGQLFTYFGTFPRQAVYTAIDAKMEADGTAVVEARGKELYEPAIDVVTQYRLGAGDRALLLRTTLTNGGKTKIAGLGLGDAIQWGGAEKFVPDRPIGFKGPTKGPYVGALGRFVSYAITSTEGSIAALSGAAWTDTEQQRDVALPPGESVTYERVFVVGRRPDVASIVAELLHASGGDVGTVAVALTDASGKAMKAPPGAKILLGTDRATGVLSVVTSGAADAIVGEVPPGTWTVAYAPSAGRQSADGQKLTIEIKKGETTRAVLHVTDPAMETFGACEEEEGGKVVVIPCKLTFEGLDGTPSPDFGPGHVAGPAKNQVTFGTKGEDATHALLLASGRYKVTASRGPEYDLTVEEITVSPRSAAAATATKKPRRLRLRRVVDTRGYVATDFHQHTIWSADAPVGLRDRAIANAAEGVEVAVASEHNVVADLGPIVRELGLTPWLVSIPGNEITTDASKKPWGHANVFPLAPQPDKPRSGAPLVRDRRANELFAESRAMPGGPHVVQVNHPRSGKNGYFSQLGFDPKTGLGKGEGYDPSFDAIEVWNGRDPKQRSIVIDDYFALLRTKHPSTPIADTDTHGIVGQEAGYPRTFVRVDDAALEAWDEARTQSLVTTVRETRDVVLSNGPFLRVTANGAPLGGIAKPRAGVVDVTVEIASAPWIEVTDVSIRFAGRGTASPPKQLLKATKNAAGALVGSVTFQVRPSPGEDDALVVFATGTRPLRPVLSGDDAEIAPFAMSAPIWIDADGDGKALGRAPSSTR